MLTILRNRTVFRILIFLIIIVILIGPSIMIPYFFGRDAEPIAVDLIAIEEPEALEALRDGYLNERGGNLEAALSDYRSALQAETVVLQDIARRSISRVFNKLFKYQAIYYDLQEYQAFSRRIRAPILAFIALIASITILGRLWPRKGIALRPFPVSPQTEADSTAAFNRLLVQEINRIARVYESEQFSRIGVKIAMPSLVSDGDQGDIWSRAMSSLREGGIEAIGTFSIGEILNFLKNMGVRPEYTLSGAVNIRMHMASARAQLKHMQNGKIIAVWDANSREAEPFATSDRDKQLSQGALVPDPSLNKTIVYTSSSRDAKENMAHLSNLAVILACKIWHSLAQGAETEMRPASWETVFWFVQALNALEEAV